MYQIYFKYTRPDFTEVEGWVVNVDSNQIGLPFVTQDRGVAEMKLTGLRRKFPFHTYELWRMQGVRCDA